MAYTSRRLDGSPVPTIRFGAPLRRRPRKQRRTVHQPDPRLVQLCRLSSGTFECGEHDDVRQVPPAGSKVLAPTGDEPEL
jgi:hypothetical protein